MMQQLELMGVDDVMDLLQVSRDTVYRLAKGGTLPGRKIGRVWRFPKDEIERFCRGQHSTECCPEGEGQEPKKPAA